MLFEAIRQWIRRLKCPHANRRLDGIVREPITYARQGSYYCPDCEHQWVSWRLPDSVSR